jgi:ATP-dependent Lhr-like helicase
MCQAIAGVLSGETAESVVLTRRGEEALDDPRSLLSAARRGRTLLTGAQSGMRWYTFAGLRANVELVARLIAHRSHISQRDNLFITLDDGISTDRLRSQSSTTLRSVN